MKSGPFIAMIAGAYRLDEGAVRVFARALKEAGLMTTGARGVNAPHMLPLDAARLTIALLATDSPARCVERVRRFGPMPLDWDRSTAGLDIDLFCGASVTLEMVVSRLFAAGSGADAFKNSPYLEILENAKSARIEMVGGIEAEFRDAHRPEPLRDADAREFFGIRRVRGVSSAELMRVAVGLLVDPAGFPEIIEAREYIDKSLGDPTFGDSDTFCAMQARIGEFHNHPERFRPDWWKGTGWSGQ